MPGRSLKLGQRFMIQAASLRTRDAELCRDVMREVSGLSTTAERADDCAAIMPPDGTPWLVRRVQSRNVWIWFRVSDEQIFVGRLSVVPPVPIEG